MTYSTRQIGRLHSLEYRLYIQKDGTPISPFHDIPLWAEETRHIANMIVEVPRWTQAKLEVRSIHLLSLSLSCLDEWERP